MSYERSLKKSKLYKFKGLIISTLLFEIRFVIVIGRYRVQFGIYFSSSDFSIGEENLNELCLSFSISLLFSFRVFLTSLYFDEIDIKKFENRIEWLLKTSKNSFYNYSECIERNKKTFVRTKLYEI